MAKIEIYNQKGEVSGEMELPKALEAEWNPDLVHQVIVAMAANRRKPVAHTKTRGEVSGGGKKPWRQKGTGRARHGSIRSPLWKGGGVTFGPRKEKIYHKKINKKMLKKAMLSVIFKKAGEGEIKALEPLILNTPKTKILVPVIKKITKNNSAVLIIPRENKNANLAARNLARIKILFPENINVYDFLKYKEILIDKKVLNGLVEKFNTKI